MIIEVEDTGVGMDEEALARVFEPYFSTKTTGTGLGLPIARRNIELNGGTIDVESEKGRGTLVTIRLPLRSVTAQPTGSAACGTVLTAIGGFDRPRQGRRPRLYSSRDRRGSAAAGGGAGEREARRRAPRCT